MFFSITVNNSHFYNLKSLYIKYYMDINLWYAWGFVGNILVWIMNSEYKKASSNVLWKSSFGTEVF